jgi:stearoyl-CoA desaturase (delta-9 desaturase)
LTKSTFERVFMTICVVTPLLGTLYAIVLLWQRYVTWNDIFLMAGMYLTTGLGITIGYHRMLTHRSFEAHPLVRFLLLAFGSMAAMGPARLWAATHIKHHANTDREDDPHSPIRGFFYSHIGWFITGFKTELNIYGTWMDKDRFVMFMSKTFAFWAVLGFVIPFLFGYGWGGWWGGWVALVWGGLVRVFLMHHVTWSVNSICHMYGRKMFATSDMSRNNWLVGLLAFGEGWHNNHHAFPRSAFHGLRWWQFDLSAYIIRFLERLGLVWNVWRVPAKNLEARLLRSANEMATHLKSTQRRASES